MNLTGRVKLYRKDFDGRPSYSRAISSQEYKDGQKGDWITVFESVQMPKGTNLADRTVIDVKRAFEATYRTKAGNKRKTVVLEYVVLDEKRKEAESEGFSALGSEEFPF